MASGFDDFDAPLNPEAAAKLAREKAEAEAAAKRAPEAEKAAPAPVEASAPSEPVVEIEEGPRFPTFEPITKFFTDTPRNDFADPEFYKKIMGTGGEEAERLHSLLGKYLKAADPQDKGVYRTQIVSAFWNFAAKAVIGLPGSGSRPKELFFRFAALHPTVLSEDTRKIFNSIIWEKTTDEPVYYLDEWFTAVARGEINASATDEAPVRVSDDRARLVSLIEKMQGKRDGALGVLKSKLQTRRALETELKASLNNVLDKEDTIPGKDYPSPYDEAQHASLLSAGETIRKIFSNNNDYQKTLAELKQAEADLVDMNGRLGGMKAEAGADLKLLTTEFETIRQMAKIAIGRQGQAFPILTSEYFRLQAREVGTREFVLRCMSEIEAVDPEAFCRLYKGELYRIVPYVVLLPTYGDYGLCWEPFDKNNRASSRARIAVSMYARNVKIAVAIAVADLRWQLAKELTGYRWMEEGLTGYYYNRINNELKMKGDIKQFFINDYLLWITRESEGMMKLDKEVRAIFWRFMPFPKKLRETLKMRSTIYGELYQRDQNRARSDGY